jgi:branched-chain amino acid aminotransferase
MSAKQGIVYIDGTRRDDPKVSVYDRGFLYGDSVFEVIRTYGSKCFGLEEHVARLHRSAAKIAMDLPWSESALVEEIAVEVKEAGFPESYVRAVVTRGEGTLGLDPDLAVHPTRVVMVHPLTLPSVEVYRDGVAVYAVSSLRATDGTAAEGAKSSNYLANLLALREAKKHGAYEPLFLEGDLVLEGGTSNVFLIEGKTLVTPPERRILGGITRRHVMESAPRAGFTVKAEPIELRRFLDADELFLTSTVREIVPIVKVIVGEQTHAVRSGQGVRAIHRAFREHVGAPTSPMPWER